MARIVAFKISRSVFWCFDSLNRLCNASKSTFDKSITGAGLFGAAQWSWNRSPATQLPKSRSEVDRVSPPPTVE